MPLVKNKHLPSASASASASGCGVVWCGAVAEAVARHHHRCLWLGPSTHAPLGMRAWAHYSSNKLSAHQNVLSNIMCSLYFFRMQNVSSAKQLQQACNKPSIAPSPA
jgi:hypothetical protein